MRDLFAMRKTTGMKMATTPVDDMTDPRKPTASISSTSRRQTLSPPRLTSQSPMPRATPVRARASPITNMAPMSTMLELLNPAIASSAVMTPVKGSSTIMIRATASTRGRFSANIRMAAASRARTIRRSEFIACPVRITTKRGSLDGTGYARAPSSPHRTLT